MLEPNLSHLILQPTTHYIQLIKQLKRSKKLGIRFHMFTCKRKGVFHTHLMPRASYCYKERTRKGKMMLLPHKL